MDPVHLAGSRGTDQRDSHLGRSPVDTSTLVEKTSAEDQEEVALAVAEVGHSQLG